jgi:hypothetical protein
MTNEDTVYAVWLNLLGSDEINDHNEDTVRDLHLMHASADMSHGCLCSSGSPENYEGPRADCPLHGDPAVLGYDPREVQR